jgi:hypothetical protein
MPAARSSRRVIFSIRMSGPDRYATIAEKNLEGWEKLRVEMISELKGKQKELTEMKKTLPSLLQSHRGLLTAVLTAVQ